MIKDLTGLSYKKKNQLFIKAKESDNKYIFTACYQSFYNLT